MKMEYYFRKILKLLGDEPQSLFEHTCHTVKKEELHLPGPDFVDRVMMYTDRSGNVLLNYLTLYKMFTSRRT